LIALDTNVVVRLIVQDPPGQVAIAERILRNAVERRLWGGVHFTYKDAKDKTDPQPPQRPLGALPSWRPGRLCRPGRLEAGAPSEERVFVGAGRRLPAYPRRGGCACLPYFSPARLGLRVQVLHANGTPATPSLKDDEALRGGVAQDVGARSRNDGTLAASAQKHVVLAGSVPQL